MKLEAFQIRSRDLQPPQMYFFVGSKTTKKLIASANIMEHYSQQSKRAIL